MVGGSPSPPQPTDLAHVEEYEVDRCRYCLEVVDNLSEHYEDTECSTTDLTELSVHNTFGIVIPEKSGYLWSTKTDAFANRHVNIQETYIPIGNVTSTELADDEFPVNMGQLNLDEFDNSQELRRIVEKGVVESENYNYGRVDFGCRLVEERLDGVYTDDEEVRERKLETRDERIKSVWSKIDDELPFTYERVAAPRGYSRTREGMRWIEITGHNYPDFAETEREKAMFRNYWVENLMERGPVAFYYPNSH
jgi:hypothetical protein